MAPDRMLHLGIGEIPPIWERSIDGRVCASARGGVMIMGNAMAIGHQLRQLMQVLAIGALAAMAAAALGATLGAALGLLPWLSAPLAYGGAAFDAGPAIQVGGAVLLLALAFALPSSFRVMRLESSHRRFAIGMEDIARAYHTAHADDRRGAFRMRSEFDAVRERLAHLREHPDLGSLEPEVLEVAAQMSVQSRHLAEVYADDKLSRAERFLQQRQEEVERMREILAKARHSARELERWAEGVGADEAVVEEERARLEAELREILPAVERPRDGSAANVVRMTAAE